MFHWYQLIGFAILLNLTFSHPIEFRESLGDAGSEVFSLSLVGLGFLLLSIFFLALCACCRERNDGFKPEEEQQETTKEFSNPGSLTNVGFTNALATEVAIFPPPGVDRGPSLSPEPTHVESVGHTPPSRPAGFSSTIPDISDWFDDVNFPRQQLFYQKEIGKGWFGKVVEGEARGSKVIVRILREDATPDEKAYFLHEAKPYRDLRHKNICSLFGRCLEIDPYLLIFELQNNRDLKNFLVVNCGSRRAITEQGISLKLMIDVCEGLQFMNDNNFIHTDIAARNCLVSSDLTVKIGDYGTSIDVYRNEYYIAGDVAVPIRWCAPETLHCTTTTIETKQVTKKANVWSLAVLLWEIAEFGRLPYDNLTDDQVIVRVFGDEGYRLPQPDSPFGQYLYNVMQICWKSNATRATIDQVHSMLSYLKTNPFQESDFEARWKKLKPNCIPVVTNHTPIHSPRHTELAQRPRLLAKSEYDSGVDLEIKATDENNDSCKNSTPMTISPQLSVTSEDTFQVSLKKSPSLTNLPGSFEEVSQFDSWLHGVEQKTEEDRKFVRNISEAIKNLDETLALEKTSSSSTDSSLEGHKKPLLDFKLGPISSGRKSESSSDTEEETWRHRVERGEFTEKVKEKSKSVTDLMVLTHIDSEESENDSLPSLTKQYSLKRSGPKGTTYTSIGFGSEGNIRDAVLSAELQEKLKSLTVWRPDQYFLGTTPSKTGESTSSVQEHASEVFLGDKSSDVIPSIIRAEGVQLGKTSDVKVESEASSDEKSYFLVEAASETLNLIDTQDNQRGNRTSSDCSEQAIVNRPLENVNNFTNVVNSKNTKEPALNNPVNLARQTPEAAFPDFSSIESPYCVFNSSHPDNCVPKIVITESELISPEPEPEIHTETHHLVKVKPRRFVFLCKDDKSEDGKEVEDEMETCKVTEGKDTGLEEDSAEKSSVILGACEEHTLDFFKGLKTTFSPVDYSDDEEKDWPPSPSSNNDECLEDEHTSESTVVALQGSNDKSTQSALSVQQSVDDNSETYESSPTNSDSYVILNQMSDHCEDHSSVKASDDLVEVLTNADESLEKVEMSSGKPVLEQTREQTGDTLESSKDSGCELTNGKVDSLSSSDPTKQELTTDDSYSELNSSPLQDSPVNVTKASACNSIEVNPSLLLKKGHASSFASKPTKKVGKSKSLESVLCSKGDLEAANLSNNRSALPVFSLVEIPSEDVFPDNTSFDSYFSIDSGHSSDRCLRRGSDRIVDQDKQMNDLKTRLEDVIKYNGDYQLKNSEEEYGGKLLTPDDERSSDSGFRDKGSLSESVEDTCDEKYNLEDIDAELEDFALKGVEKEDMKYYSNLDFTPDQEKVPGQNIEGWFLHSKNNECNGWVPLSTEDEERQVVSLDDEFVAALRIELEEKLPRAQFSQKVGEEPVAEQEIVEQVVQFPYPAQLSPILEEQESNQSSLVYDDMSPIVVLPPPEINITAFREDIIRALEADESPEKDDSLSQEDINELVLVSDKYPGDDDVLVVDIETNEVTMIESPKPKSQLSFILSRKLNENIDDESTAIESETYIVSSGENYAPSPSHVPLTPDMSLDSNTLSSPENGNISGMYLSPCSIRSDLFDSGPPSLPFDLGQSLEDAEDLFVDKTTEKTISAVRNFLDVEKSSYDIDDDISDSTTLKPSYCEFVAKDDIETLSENQSRWDSSLPERDSLDDWNQAPSIHPTNIPPIIVAEGSTAKHMKAELEIDLLLENPAKTEDVFQKEAALGVKDDNIDLWLRDFFLETDLSVKGALVSEGKAAAQGWPNNEELLQPKSFEEKNSSLKPSLSSTLALMSPDMSSTDSKSHSLLSSFSSTPTFEDSSMFQDGIREVPRIAAPSSLPLNGTVVYAPMPSPEDVEKDWRPTMGQLMELTNQADGEEMTTSFIEPDENGVYTPDWDSDTSDEQSSSSGEFVWKEGERDDVKTSTSDTTASMQEPAKMERIVEEEEEEESHEGELNDDSSSEGSGTEFVPSTWNAKATPVKPSIKLSIGSNGRSVRKRVVFKKEKYQCIYEYPREPSDDEESPEPWQTPNTSAFDYSTFADWEFGEVEGNAPPDADTSDNEDSKNTKKPQDYDFYRLNYSMGPHLITEDGEFYISSSSKAFEWSEGDSNEFFPGRITDDLEFTPEASELTPLSLGELRHTKDSLRLELPAVISRNLDKAEACFLDSGIDSASPLDKPRI